MFNRRHDPQKADSGSAFANAPDGDMMGTAVTGYLVMTSFVGLQWLCFDSVGWKADVPINIEYLSELRQD